MITRSTYGSFHQVGFLMQQAAAQLQQTQLDAVTLDRLAKPSNHPADSGQAVQLDAELASHQALIDRLELTHAELATADDALSQAATLLSSAIETAMAMATESYGDQDRSQAAEAIGNTIADMAAVANAKFGSVYVFAGTATTTEPFETDGTYVGGSSARTMPLLGDDTLMVGKTGDEVFKASGVDVFDALGELQTALNNDNAAAVGGCLDTLNLAFDHLVEMRSAFGMAQVRVEDLTQVSEDATLALEGFLGGLKELDAIDAFAKLSQAQTIYQAAATTMSQVLQTNIFQYL